MWIARRPRYKKKCRTRLFKQAVVEAEAFVHDGVEPEGFNITVSARAKWQWDERV